MIVTFYRCSSRKEKILFHKINIFFLNLYIFQDSFLKYETLCLSQLLDSICSTTKQLIKFTSVSKF